MFDWLWKSWKRKPAHPPNSLAYFQVYGDGPEPPSDYPGPVWRCQVPHEVKLECHLLPVVDEPSFLTLPKRPLLRVHPPVFKVAGQLKAERPETLPIDDWLAQGTLWWLKHLGKPQVAGFLAFLLMAGHAQLDRQRFPEIDQAFSFLLPAAAPKPAPPPLPLVVVAQQPVRPRLRPWGKFPITLELGPARVQFLDRRDGKCCWRVNKREFWQPLWEDLPLSLLIEVDEWEGTDAELAEQLRLDFKASCPGLLARLARYPAANRRLRPLLQRL